MSKKRRFTKNQLGIVKRLLNGPWPCDFSRGMIRDQSPVRGEHNAHTAIARLVKVGLVEEFLDKATSRLNWRIKRNRFDLPVIGHISTIREWE